MYASLRSGQTARAITTDLPITTEKKCAEMYVFMNGGSNAVLNVYVRESGKPTPSDPALTLQGDQGNQWVRALLTVDPQPKAFQVCFSGFYEINTQFQWKILFGKKV